MRKKDTQSQLSSDISRLKKPDFYDKLFSLSKKENVSALNMNEEESDAIFQLNPVSDSLPDIDFSVLNMEETALFSIEETDNISDDENEQSSEEVFEEEDVSEEEFEEEEIPEEEFEEEEIPEEEFEEEDVSEEEFEEEEIPEGEFEEEEIPEEEFEEKDVSADEDVMAAFGLASNKEKKAQNRMRSDENETDKSIEREQRYQIPEFGTTGTSAPEYTDASQNRDVFVSLKMNYNFAKFRLILAGILVVLLGVLENIPPIEKLFGSFTFFAVTDWILAVLAAVLIFDRLCDAAKSLFRLEVDCDTVALCVFVFSCVATGTSLLLSAEKEMVYLCNFPVAICAFLSLLRLLILLRRDIYSFKIISSPQVKTVLADTVPGQAAFQERAVFSEYLEEGGRVCAVKKTEFVSSFFSHRNEKAYSKSLLKIFLPECIIFSVLFFMVSFFVMKNDFVQSMNTAYISFLMSAPFTTFIAYSYPLYRASSYAYSRRCAIVGDKTHEHYEKTAVIAVRDEEVFSGEHTKIIGINLYMEQEIETILSAVSALYDRIGGPLSSAFKRMANDVSVPEQIELKETAYNGVRAVIDGKTIMVGTQEYMIDRRIDFPCHGNEAKYSGNCCERILYVAYEGEAAMRLYAQYQMDSRFMKMARRLAENGVAVSVRTADPFIDDGLLLYHGVNTEESVWVKVVNGIFPEQTVRKHSAKHGGIVSIGSVRDLAKTFMVCEKIADVRKINFILKTTASVLGLILMALMLFTGHTDQLLSVIPAVYQLLWFIPILLISKKKI